MKHPEIIFEIYFQQPAHNQAYFSSVEGIQDLWMFFTTDLRWHVKSLLVSSAPWFDISLYLCIDFYPVIPDRAQTWVDMNYNNQ